MPAGYLRDRFGTQVHHRVFVSARAAHGVDLLRVALCEVLSGSGEPLPLLLDEPMLTADPARRELMLEFLHRLSETNQVVVTTSDPTVIDAVRRAGADEYSVVHLGADPVAEVSGRHSARVRVL